MASSPPRDPGPGLGSGGAGKPLAGKIRQAEATLDPEQTC